MSATSTVLTFAWPEDQQNDPRLSGEAQAVLGWLVAMGATPQRRSHLRQRWGDPWFSRALGELAALGYVVVVKPAKASR